MSQTAGNATGFKKSALALGLACLPMGGCHYLRTPVSGGQAEFSGHRPLRPQDIAVPTGFRVELVASGLTFPTAVVFDDERRLYVLEAGYSYGDSWALPRLMRLEPDDRWTVIASGDRNGPWTGAVYHQGFFYIAEGGQLEGGRILRLDKNGRASVLVEGLPSLGDHHTAGPAIGPDGMLYFGQGTATNAGVVGDDNDFLGWLGRFPDFHDIPCEEIELAGHNFPTAKGLTGAFVPIGTITSPGQRVTGRLPCNGAILRTPLEGGELELVAWGFRNPFGLAFRGSELFVTDAGYDERGSRPVWGAADLLWKVREGAWYGWPDYSGDRPLSLPEFARGKGSLPLVLAKSPGKPPRPSAWLPSSAFSAGIDFSTSSAFGYVGDAFIAQFGDRAPFSGPVLRPVGFKIVRLRLETGVLEDFAVNKGRQNGPASLSSGGGLERPISVRFDPSGHSLYIVDFGVITTRDKAASPRKNTGVIWRITRRV
ncbi:MAG: glucose dehydrogenase [Elusimicrobia bacterium]|nr:glucose dehydrogenase [Elusimicrobiota bacterium]